MVHDAARALHEELPEHSRWVQELARSLVRDEARAEDLAQDAQLAALRSGASLPRPLGPWLARVTRNFARRGWRDAARRAARERAVARPEALPGADETAARLEIQRRLVEELAALAPAVRHALVRRYLDGWTAARIARESGEPAATVRWRLQRGLAELRVRLDEKSGGDGIQWRLALLPLCGSASPWTAWLERPLSPAGAATIQGALTMKAASQVLAASAVPPRRDSERGGPSVGGTSPRRERAWKQRPLPSCSRNPRSRLRRSPCSRSRQRARRSRSLLRRARRTRRARRRSSRASRGAASTRRSSRSTGPASPSSVSCTRRPRAPTVASRWTSPRTAGTAARCAWRPRASRRASSSPCCARKGRRASVT